MATNIFAAYAQPVRSVQDYQNEMARGDALAANTAAQRQQNAIAAAAAQQATEGQAALMQAYQGDPAGLVDRLMRDPRTAAQGLALRKAAEESAKSGAEVGLKTAQTKAAEVKITQEQRNAAIQRAAALRTPQDAMSSLRQAVLTGEVSMKQAEEMARQIPSDPDGFLRWKYNTVLSLATPEQQAQGMTPTVQTRNTGGSTDTLAVDKITGKATVTGSVNNTQSPESVASIAQQERASLRADARSRDANTSTMTKPFEVTGPDGVPILVRQDKQGNISRVEGFGPKAGAAKPLNDTQAKALLFGSRMQASGKILSDLEDKGVLRPGSISQSAQTAAGMVPFIGDKLADVAGTATNWTQSPEQQSVEQARRDFINAVLRRESGAVISPAEFANAEKQYFPVVGNPPELIAQKRRNRELATRGLMAEVPQGQRDSITKAPPNAGVTVDWGDLK